MQYTVVHSKDPYLLARLATDLQMEGVDSDDSWDKLYNPFSDYKSIYFGYMAIGEDSDKTFRFYSHNCPYCNNNNNRHELTSRNYIKVLTQILEP